MGAPKVSSAILTTSMARTTPAQKPRGFNSKIRFSVNGEPSRVPAKLATVSLICTTSSIPSPDPLGQGSGGSNQEVIHRPPRGDGPASLTACFEHLLGMPHGGLCEPGSAQHPGNFFSTCSLVEQSNRRPRPSLLLPLLDEQVLVSKSGYLR